MTHLRSNFNILRNDEKIVVLQDTGITHTSLTNDIENVVEYLYEEEILNADKQLFYYDSENELTSAIHAEERFKAFGYPDERARDMIENGLMPER